MTQTIPNSVITNKFKQFQEPNTSKAEKVLQLSEELRNTKLKRKTLMRAYTEEINRISEELEAVLSGEPTNEELLQKEVDGLEIID